MHKIPDITLETEKDKTILYLHFLLFLRDKPSNFGSLHKDYEKKL